MGFITKKQMEFQDQIYDKYRMETIEFFGGIEICFKARVCKLKVGKSGRV